MLQTHGGEDCETEGITFELSGDLLSSVGYSQTSGSVHLYLLNASGLLHVIALSTKPHGCLSSVDVQNVHLHDISAHLSGASPWPLTRLF